MKTTEFRKELLKIMPGYKWTVHRPFCIRGEKPTLLSATGIQTSGFNRLSTLEITKWEKDGKIGYAAKTAGYGKKAIWLSTYKDKTLARALRGLQNHYEYQAALYANHAGALQRGRKSPITAHPQLRDRKEAGG